MGQSPAARANVFSRLVHENMKAPREHAWIALYRLRRTFFSGFAPPISELFSGKNKALQ
jgi:hypothetical protein